MSPRTTRPASRYWTLLFITTVTVLIWIWAASETRSQQRVDARVKFLTPDPQGWVIEPQERAVTLTAEGSAYSIQLLTTLVKTPIAITIRAEAGDQQFDLGEVLANHPDVTKTGVNIRASVPPVVEISVDRIERVSVPIRVVNLSGVQVEGDVKVDPPEAMVDIPSKLHRREPNLVANADLPPGLNLEPGPKTSAARLQLPELLRAGGAKIVSPADRTVQVAFTVRSLTDSMTLPTVNVQVAGPPEDHENYIVEVLDDVLRQVKVEGDHDLIRRIENDEVKVFAMVHLTSEDKDRRIDSKTASFVAVTPDGTMVSLKGSVDGAATPPLIHLRITPRAAPTPAS